MQDRRTKKGKLLFINNLSIYNTFKGIEDRGIRIRVHNIELVKCTIKTFYKRPTDFILGQGRDFVL